MWFAGHKNIAIALSLTACAANPTVPARDEACVVVARYHGEGRERLQKMCERAAKRSEEALLDLGIEFEEGARLKKNTDLAISLYEAVVAVRPMSVQVYQPALPNEQRGTIQFFQIEGGLQQEAMRRLVKLRSMEIEKTEETVR